MTRDLPLSVGLGSSASPLRFRVKVCGVTTPQDAEIVAAAGPDAIGLNFCATSPRVIDIEVARKIDRLLPSEISRVAVVVNAAIEEIRRIRDSLRLDYVQLHGDESPEFVAELQMAIPALPLIRAFRCRDQGLHEVARYVERCAELGVVLSGLLVDAHHPGQYGGTGKTLDWDQLADRPDTLSTYALILAGGLGPRNVAEAVRRARPTAVDTASGVERDAGVKDAVKVRQFVEEARRALRRLESGNAP